MVGLGDWEWLGRSRMPDEGRGLRLLARRGIATLLAGWLGAAVDVEAADGLAVEAEAVPSISVESIEAFLLLSSPLCFLLLRVQPFLLDALGSVSSGSGTAGAA